MTVERSITFEPAFDRRNPDPSKNYGIGGVNIRWVLKSGNKAVQFLVLTDWTPVHVQNERMSDHFRTDVIGIQPMAADLGYHSPEPMYDEQESMACDVLDSQCYGSSLNAEPVRDRLIAEGGDAVWDELEKYFKARFEENTDG